MDKKHIIGVVILVLVVGAGAFFGGTVYEKNTLNASGLLRSGGNNGQYQAGTMMNGNRGQGQPGQGQQAGRMNRGGNGGNFLVGEILSKDDTSITIKTKDGSSKIVYFSDSTTVGKSTQGSSADLATGVQITVGGQPNADGSIAAQNIQIK